jgi:hypothetical protein
MTTLENSADLDSEGFAAGIALVQPDPVGLAFERPRAVEHAAVGANATVRPNPCLDVGIGGDFVIEVGGRKDGLGHG